MFCATSPTRLLMLLASSLIASGCAEQVRPVFPSSADLRAEAKPVPPPEVFTSAVAAAQYEADVEAWGERGWAAVHRLCEWNRAMGMKVVCE